jgi:hypothetical protein
MGIDGIGRSNTPPTLDATRVLEQKEVTTGDLTGVEGATPSAVAGSEATSSSSLFSRLQSGEVSREQYLDQRVDEAIRPFESRMSKSQLEFMRTTLREQLELDPTLIELTRQATDRAGTK